MNKSKNFNYKAFLDGHFKLGDLVNLRTDSFDDLSEDQRMALNSIAAGLFEAKTQNNILFKDVEHSSKQLEELALNVIDSMSIVFEQKSESIEKLRSWRKTIESETRAAEIALKSVENLLTNERLKRLESLVCLMERLGSIDSSDIINKILKIS